MKKDQNKIESELVTKESFSASFMLFSFLALLMLCTREIIFGDMGVAIHTFLIGMFGYFAYPILIGATYLFFMMLIGKRLVKNRLAGTLFALSLIFAGLIVHTAMTTSWGLDGYAEKCYEAGNSLSTCTVTGLVGGLIISATRSLIANVGAIILFSVLFLVCGYFFILCVRKNKTKDENKSNTIKKEKKQPVPKPVQNETQQPKNGQETNRNQNSNPMPQAQYQPTQTATGDMRYTQRPAVRLTDENSATNDSDTYGFSPFGTNNQATPKKNETERFYGDARQFLFGSGARESYKQNLIFDPNANVNNLPPVEPVQMPTTPVTSSSYTPSYTEDYQNSVNQGTTNIRPEKVVTDNAYGLYEEPHQNEGYSQTAQTYNFDTQAQESESAFSSSRAEENAPIMDRNEETERLSYMEPLKPIEEIPSQTIDNSYLEPERTEYLDVKEDVPSAPQTYARDNVTDYEEPSFESTQDSSTRNTGYQRHEFMGLFSVDNPTELNHDDVFKTNRETETSYYGRANDEEPSFDTRSSDRSFDERPAYQEEEFDERTGRDRDGLNLFDDEEEFDNPYVLQSDYEEPRREFHRDSYEERGRDSRMVEEPIETERGRVFDESPEDLPPPIQPPKATQTNTQKPAAEPVAASVAPPTPPKPRVIKPYVRISLDDLDCRDVEPTQNPEEVEEIKETIIATLEEFKISGATIASVTFGPTVTRYNVTLPCGVLPSKVISLDQLISMKLHTEGVSIYPNFKNGAVSVEVPNTQRQFVQLGSMLSGDTYVNAKPSSLMFAMGKDVSNQKVYGDISKMIHLLVAGASGSGKSVFLGALIISLIHKYSPEELRLILIDPKKTEFVLYNELPHLMINEIITDANKAVQSLNWAIEEMNRRYGLFQEMSNAGTYVVNLDQYNEKLEKAKRLPKIVIIIDELADLMLEAKKDMEEKVQNLTQKARAAGIHLIVATQRPSTDVITGVIKSNLPTRIAFGVASEVDSRVILDQTGAHKLLGKGDFLYTMQGLNTPVRVQSAFISPEESQKVVNFIKANNEAYYDEAATAYINNTKGSSNDSAKGDRDVEPVYIDALRYVILSGSASISMIQRKCSAGYNKAGKIIEWMEEMGYISPFEGAKARKVLISKEEFESKYGPL